MPTMPEYSVENVDHLGIVAGLCRQLGLEDKINRRIHPNGSERVVNTGQSVIALILNGLGYTQRRLYLTEQFFQNKPVDQLIGANLKASDLTGDTLGKALDDIADYGETRLFSEIATAMALEQNLLSGPFRMDTTSFSTQGAYKTDEGEGVITVTQGYSKDHRPDLNQVVLSLVMKGPAELPIHMNALDGNSSDKTSFGNSVEQVEALKNAIDSSTTSRWIADSALYTQQNLKKLSAVEWITRAPELLTEVKSIVEKPKGDYEWQVLDHGYSITPLSSNYAGVAQRWLLVFSEQSYVKEEKTLLKNVDKERHQADKQSWQLSCQNYGCQEDALAQADKVLKKLKYHKGSIEVLENKGYEKKGRPKPGDQQVIKGYTISITLKKDELAIQKALCKKGRFILATNILDESTLSNQKILEEYKQQQQPERGFRFIKNPEFLVNSIFLKSARRIQALLMIMTLTLFIYNLGQYLLRQRLVELDETVPNQKKKPTQTPTLRWIFELMQGIGLITITATPAGPKQRIYAKMTEVQQRIIRVFGDMVEDIYCLNQKSGILGF
jgi:transposase